MSVTFDQMLAVVVPLIPALTVFITLTAHRRGRRADARRGEVGADADLGKMFYQWAEEARNRAESVQERLDALERERAQARKDMFKLQQEVSWLQDQLRSWRLYANALAQTLMDNNLPVAAVQMFGLDDADARE